MPLFRCLECRAEFEATQPACVACGIDPAADQRDADMVVPLMVHHFDAPGRRAGRGVGFAACNPKLKVGSPKCMFTGEPGSVNCPKCKLTEVFLAAGGLSAGPDPDLKAKPVEPKGG